MNRSSTDDRVYPRACGGTHTKRTKPTYTKGLSPRMRGNRPVDRPGNRLRGSIPAHAGEPRSRSPWPPCTWVYPRACGGTLSLRRPAAALYGVYPRACGGTTTIVGMPMFIAGSIPAHAGEPAGPVLADCGRRGSIPAHAGEPKIGLHGARQDRGGSIPAHAGEPRTSSATHYPWGGSAGLSPRMRGNLSQPVLLDSPVTGLSPRMRGNPETRSSGRTARGLSPRMRGNRGPATPDPRAGSIPAHAGEPGLDSAICRYPWNGLSPRMRGNRVGAPGLQ